MIHYHQETCKTMLRIRIYAIFFFHINLFASFWSMLHLEMSYLVYNISEHPFLEICFCVFTVKPVIYLFTIFDVTLIIEADCSQYEVTAFLCEWENWNLNSQHGDCFITLSREWSVATQRYIFYFILLLAPRTNGITKVGNVVCVETRGRGLETMSALTAEWSRIKSSPGHTYRSSRLTSR